MVTRLSYYGNHKNYQFDCLGFLAIPQTIIYIYIYFNLKFFWPAHHVFKYGLMTPFLGDVGMSIKNPFLGDAHHHSSNGKNVIIIMSVITPFLRDAHPHPSHGNLGIGQHMSIMPFHS